MSSSSSSYSDLCKHACLGLFFLVVVIGLMNPMFVNNMYEHPLGKILLIGLVLIFAANHIVLGILLALFLFMNPDISSSFGFGSDDRIMEGMDVQQNIATDKTNLQAKVADSTNTHVMNWEAGTTTPQTKLADSTNAHAMAWEAGTTKPQEAKTNLQNGTIAITPTTLAKGALISQHVGDNQMPTPSQIGVNPVSAIRVPTEDALAPMNSRQIPFSRESMSNPTREVEGFCAGSCAANASWYN